MRYRRLKLDRRGDISSPIIVILVTVAALAVAGMAIAWMASTGSRASSQGSLEVIGTPALTGNTLYLTLKNVGTASVTLVNATITISSTNYYASTLSPSPIAAGDSKAVTITFTGSLSTTAGTPYPVSLLTNEGTVQFTAIAQ
jgi:hypothetical protein